MIKNSSQWIFPNFKQKILFFIVLIMFLAFPLAFAIGLYLLMRNVKQMKQLNNKRI